MKTRIISSIFCCLLIIGMALPGAAFAGGVRGAQKLEGAWVAKAPDAGGQWTYVLSADPSGRHATGHGSVEIGFNVVSLFGPYDDVSPLLIAIRMTGPETAVANTIWYGRRELPITSMTSHELVFIGTAESTLEFVGPDEIEAVHNFAFYDASKDVDGDGFPDSDQTPDLELTLNTFDTRVTAP